MLKFDANLKRIAELALLLEENIDPGKFSIAKLQIEAHPALMKSLMAVQCVDDAVDGNARPVLRDTRAIRQFQRRGKSAADNGRQR